MSLSGLDHDESIPISDPIHRSDTSSTGHPMKYVIDGTRMQLIDGHYCIVCISHSRPTMSQYRVILPYTMTFSFQIGLN